MAPRTRYALLLPIAAVLATRLSVLPSSRGSVLRDVEREVNAVVTGRRDGSRGTSGNADLVNVVKLERLALAAQRAGEEVLVLVLQSGAGDVEASGDRAVANIG